MELVSDQKAMELTSNQGAMDGSGKQLWVEPWSRGAVEQLDQPWSDRGATME